MLKHCLFAALAAVLPGLLFCAAQADIVVRDDLGKAVALSQPAKRVIALSPHAVELVYALGAGSQLVAAVEGSDTPEAARRLPRVGSHTGFDLERIAALKPDLIIAWPMGGERQLQRLESLGIAVFRSAPVRLEDIATSLLPLGQLLGHEAQAENAQQAFQQRLQSLRSQYSQGSPVRVFYQVWAQPLMTVGGRHTISDALHVCGAQNIFADLSMPAPSVSREAVLQRHPQVVIASGRAAPWPTLKQSWKPLRVAVVESDALSRPVPRMLDAVAQMCEKIEQIRQGVPSP